MVVSTAMTKRMSMLLLALALALGACGDDQTEVATPGAGGGTETNEPSPGGAGDEMPEPVCLGPNERLPDFQGIPVEQAEAMAEDQGLTVREVGRDGECFAVTEDYRTDRVNIEIVADMVVAAAIY